jgi:two-component system, chemotaxis family, CheB/CheR fusion protein
MQAVVGLGGSAGSIKALQTFFAQMPTDSGLAFVVVLHLSPEFESSLAALLQKSTPMPVAQVSKPVLIEANRVYVIPPGKHLLIADGHLILRDLPSEYGMRTAVDIFFRTLAETHGSRSTAIILSGLDGDGSIGIKRIKENGGLTVAQDPGEAEHRGMPRSAIETGMVDWVLPVAEIPSRLLEYQSRQRRVRLPAESRPAFTGAEEQDDEDALREALSLLRVRIGQDFSCYKRGTILRRIGRRMQVGSINDLPSYMAFLRLNPDEAISLQQDLLASGTNFFRDQKAFQALKAQLIKLSVDKAPGEQIRVWIPGVATGEEAYSIAILLAESASKLKEPSPILVFATDVDQESIDVGRAGIYPETVTADVSQKRLQQFFSKESAGYRLKRTVREMVVFGQHDLLKDPPFSRLDLISCRNLLIYLNADAQRRAFAIFDFALREKGILFLGASESADGANTPFIRLHKKYKLYARGPAGSTKTVLLKANSGS